MDRRNANAEGDAGSPWDVPGLGVDVGALLGELNQPAARRPAPTAPSVDARSLLDARPALRQDIGRCQGAIATARESVARGWALHEQDPDPRARAWLILMDELLGFGDAMTGKLLQTRG